MAFTNLTAFLAMGGHGTYIWSAYAIFLLAIFTLHLSTKIHHHRLTAQLNALKHL